MFLEDFDNLNRLSGHHLVKKTILIALDECWLSLPWWWGWSTVTASEIQVCYLNIYRHCLIVVDGKNGHNALLFFSVPSIWSSLLTWFGQQTGVEGTEFKFWAWDGSGFLPPWSCRQSVQASLPVGERHAVQSLLLSQLMTSHPPEKDLPGRHSGGCQHKRNPSLDRKN